MGHSAGRGPSEACLRRQRYRTERMEVDEHLAVVTNDDDVTRHAEERFERSGVAGRRGGRESETRLLTGDERRRDSGST